MSSIPVSRTTSRAAAELPPLRIAYEKVGVRAALARPDTLAAIGFGRGGEANGDPRAFRVGLDPLGEPAIEVWTANGPVRSGRHDRVRWTSDGDYGFVAIEIDEAECGGIEPAAELAYRELSRFVAAGDTPHVLRFWNYLDAINLGAGDDERYRRFCVGRARGMGDAPRSGYPAATAIGRRDAVRTLQVYALVARSPGAPVENPRQVSAWRYPREFGPTPPTFARGMIAPARQLLISGTAAVVGSASQHRDDTAAQLDETLNNIATLIRTASDGGLSPRRGALLKAYVRNTDEAALIERVVRERMPGLDGLLLLAGEICRRELLVEIDGVVG